MRPLILVIVPLLAAALPVGLAAASPPEPQVFRDASADGALLPPRDANSTTEQLVIGSDDRSRIAETSAFPFSAIAYLELEDASGEVFGSCTATFIGPDALLTAGHCLWDAVEGDWGAEHIRVVPGKDSGFEPFGSQYAEDWWVPDAYAETGLTDWDWGVINLPNDFLTLETGWLSVSILDSESLESSDFMPTIVGYPGDKPDGTMWGHIRPAFTAVADFQLFYDIDTAPGQSGSAIWSAADGPFLGLIVGIHTTGGALNAGQRIDQELLDDLLTGCSAMGCSISVHQTVPPGPEPPGGPSTLPFRSYAVAVARE